MIKGVTPAVIEREANLSGSTCEHEDIIHKLQDKINDLEFQLSIALRKQKEYQSEIMKMQRIISQDGWSHYENEQVNVLSKVNTLKSLDSSEIEEVKLSPTIFHPPKFESHVNIIPAGDIKLRERVGKGSFGEVWRAIYQEGAVAVKLFLSEDIDVTSEIAVMAKISGQPHVLDLIGVVLEQNDKYKPPQVALVTRFMANGSLKDICTRDSPTFRSHISAETKIRFCYQAAKGVVHLHRNNVIHRDLACRNLLLDDKMDVFVADFGFARRKQVASSKGFTKTGLGPVRWEAPESLKMKEYSEKTDSFSFGVCLYEIMTGMAPWDHVPSIAMVATNVINGERMILPINCDPGVAQLMQECWVHKAGDRPDFNRIVSVLGHRHQAVCEDNRDIKKEVNTVQFMLRGNVVLKYSFEATKKPKHKYLRVTSNLLRIVWSSANTRNSIFKSSLNAQEKSIEINSIVEVGTGNFHSQSTPQLGTPSNLSMTLVTTSTILHLVCDTSQHRDTWVWGINYLLRRRNGAPKVSKIIKSLQESFSIRLPLSRAECNRVAEALYVSKGDNNLYKKRFHTVERCVSALREVAYYLQRGEIMLKFTSRKRHARHVFLSSDLNEIMWNIEDESRAVGSARMENCRSVSIADIDSISVGKQPKLLIGSSRVVSMALHLSETMKFHRAQHAHNQSDKPSAVNDETGDIVKVNAKKRRGSIQSIGDTMESFLSKQLPILKREKSKDEPSDDEDEGSKDEPSEDADGQSQGDELHDFQLCVSYVAADGRTLLALQCPNPETCDLWTIGLMTLTEGLRSYRYQDTRHSYQSGADIISSTKVMLEAANDDVKEMAQDDMLATHEHKEEWALHSRISRAATMLWPETYLDNHSDVIQANSDLENSAKYGTMPSG